MLIARKNCSLPRPRAFILTRQSVLARSRGYCGALDCILIEHFLSCQKGMVAALIGGIIDICFQLAYSCNLFQQTQVLNRLLRSSTVREMHILFTTSSLPALLIQTLLRGLT